MRALTLKSGCPEPWLVSDLRVPLAELDSSASWRIACKSSVAETIGKSRTHKQVNAKASCSDLDPRRCGNQAQKANSSSRSQQRFSNSSNFVFPALIYPVKRLNNIQPESFGNHSVDDKLVSLLRGSPNFSLTADA